VQKRLRAAHFSVVKTLEEFEFGFQPKLDAMLIKALAACEFVASTKTSSSSDRRASGKAISGPRLP